jgi:S-methylmethionine-dependent homocysteine/selenocysteine methylase
VIETLVEADQFLIHASDTSTGAMEGVAQDYWRAYFDMGSRIATLSVFALEGETVSREDSLNALRASSQSVRLANARTDTCCRSAAPDGEARPPRGGLFNVGLFRRVFD